MENLYWFKNNRHTSQKLKGFDYRNKILYKSLSHFLFDNPTLSGFLQQIEKVVTSNVESIKNIKRFRAFSINKNNTLHN